MLSFEAMKVSLNPKTRKLYVHLMSPRPDEGSYRPGLVETSSCLLRPITWARGLGLGLDLRT